MELLILIVVFSMIISVLYVALYGKFIKAVSDFDEAVVKMLDRLAV